MRSIRAFLWVMGRRFLPAPRAAAEPGELAFGTLSSDPSVLDRLPRDQARRLAAQAGAYAASVLRDGGGRAGMAARDAAAQVLRSIRRFAARDELYGGSVDEMVTSALTGAPDGLGGLLASLVRAGPSLVEEQAGLAMDAILALGEAGLQRLGRESAETLMTAASRHAASCLRGHPLAAHALDVTHALKIIEAVCAGWATLPLAPSFVGARRERAEHLLELWHDAGTCAGWRDAEGGGRLWHDARAVLAFGAVWLLPAILPALVRTEAEALAEDARDACLVVLRSASSRLGLRAAVEAARVVLVACGERVRSEANIAVSQEAAPVRVSHV